MKFITKYKKYLKISALIWLVCLVMFVLAYFLLINPQNQTTKNIEQQLTKNMQEYELAQKAAQQETKDRLNNEIELLENKFSSFVSDFKGAENLTFDISRIAEQSKVSSVNIESSDMRASATDIVQSNIYEKHIRVSFVAGFKEFALFLNALERHQPILFINEISLSCHNKDTTSYQVSLDVAAFVQKPQETATAETPNEFIVGAEL